MKSILLACLALGMVIPVAAGDIVAHHDETAFLEETGAVAEPAWDTAPEYHGDVGPYTWGSLTYSIDPSFGTLDINSSGITVTGTESIDVDIQFPVSAIGWRFSDPDGWTSISFLLGDDLVGSMVPDAGQPFYGFSSTVPFDRVEIRDTGILDDYLGQAFLVPEPASVLLLMPGLLVAARRRSV